MKLHGQGQKGSNAICNILNNQAIPNNPSQDINTVDQQSLSDFGYAFGQFMNHDMDLTPDAALVPHRGSPGSDRTLTPCPSPGPSSIRAPARA